MTIEVWILALIAATVTAGAIGFVAGRRRSTEHQRINALETELKDAEQRLREMDEGINEHFEESAELFGQLARDYRKFFQHFATSAGKLGVAEDRTDAMLASAQARLLADERGPEREVVADTAEASLADIQDEIGEEIPEEIQPQSNDEVDEEPAPRVAEVALDDAEASTDATPEPPAPEKRDQVA
jgi:uncharacterized membrane-anchored protein YhcB (DUF1043 family)